MMKVIVDLKTNRLKTGLLSVVEDGQTVLGPYVCLGKSDNAAAAKEGNPTRNPLFRNGDMPTGEWLITRVITTATNGLPIASYGPHGALDLQPFSGQCVQAYKNGRSGIWIHSGNLNAAGKLRPTYGCVRLHNDDMLQLINKLAPVLSIEKVRLIVSETA